MRKKLCALLFSVGVSLGAVATAQAETLKVNIPFEFVVDGKTLPAATYVIDQPLPNVITNLAFLGKHQGIQAMASEIDTSITGTKVLFRHIGNQYFLSDVLTREGKLHFPLSRKDQERARSAEAQSLPSSTD